MNMQKLVESRNAGSSTGDEEPPERPPICHTPDRDREFHQKPLPPRSHCRTPDLDYHRKPRLVSATNLCMDAFEY